MTRQARLLGACRLICGATLTLIFTQNHQDSQQTHNLAAQSLALLPSYPTQTQADGPPVRRVNAPYFDAKPIAEHETGIFWFGRVTPTENYADVRVGYNRNSLALQANVFDRRVWYDTNAAHNSFAELTAWDAVAFYLDTGKSTSNAPSNTTYRLATEINWSGEQSKFLSVARGNGAGWTDLGLTVPVTVEGAWRGIGPNDESDERGWFVRLDIPFSSLGLSGPPAQGSAWRLGVRLFDRDDKAGTPIPVQFWPEAMQPDAPSTWGQLGFGFPLPVHPPIAAAQSVTIQQGLNGSVMDAGVGGGTICAGQYEDKDFFTGFGIANYAKSEYFNIQNQADVADWPCFSRFYITFPLTALPPSLTVISATLTTIQFGNSGQGIPPTPYSSLIQIFTVAEDWQDTTINWNNAPLAVENVSIARSLVMTQTDPPPAIPVTWDVTQAVDEAHRNGKPLRLALYDSDAAQNSGKYFWTSDIWDLRAYDRPTLVVVLGDGGPPVPTATPAPTATPDPRLNLHTYLPISLRGLQ